MLGSALIVSSAKAQSSDSKLPDAILSALERANVLRDQRRETLEIMQREQAETEALIANLTSEREVIAKRIASINDRTQSLTQAASEQNKLTESMRDGLAELQLTIDSALTKHAELADAALDGVVQRVTLKRDSDDASEAIASLQLARSQSRDRAREVIRELKVIELDGAMQSVHFLRVGASFGWWMGLEGEAAGALRQDRKGATIIRFEQQAALAVRNAFTAHAGRSGEVIVALPFPSAWLEELRKERED